MIEPTVETYEPIVHGLDPITLVGGGQATPADLQKALTLAPQCVAADGGAALALAAGVSLSAVIGDLDSLSAATRAQIPAACIHQITEQDTTDFEKALLRIAAPLVIGVGFTGGRVDHQLAVFHALVAHASRPCVLLGAAEIIFHAPPQISLPMQKGDIVSLFPLAAVGGRSTGLRWPIEGLAFDPARRIGTSNQATGPVALQMKDPGMLVILPRRLMPSVVAQLSAPKAARWPVPAG